LWALYYIYTVHKKPFQKKFHSCLCIKIPVFLGAGHIVTRRIPCKQNAAKYVPNPDGLISQVAFGSPHPSLKMAIANSTHHAKQQNRMRWDIDRHNKIKKCLQSTPTEEDNFFPCEREVFLTQDIQPVMHFIGASLNATTGLLSLMIHELLQKVKANQDLGMCCCLHLFLTVKIFLSSHLMDQFQR
jgi:hypothetical protein